MNRFLITVAVITSALACTKEIPKEATSTEGISVFEQLDGEITGIKFNNAIQENITTNENVFDFDYFYNGAGVGVEDINNDGLLDILFTANQQPNRLYLNKGGLKFEDITEASGINQSKGWSTGVTFVDVNDDGWQDIYISQGGPSEGEKRTNRLYINQQDLTFREAAEEYGLADSSISSHSAFFDFDKDGDLDCVVMNENPLYGVDPKNFYDLLSKDADLLHYSSSHLYRNDKGSYVDITAEAGLLKPTFGLGLVVSDMNNDNWLDIYIASDYYVPDLMYINQGDGTFEDQIKQHTDQVSFFGMGADIADINNDALQEIFVLDMASADHYRAKTLMASMDTKGFDLLVNQLDLHHQYMFNSLQLNVGDGHYKNIAQLAKLSKTDWSWAVLMNDFDNSGYKDIFITNGYRRYALDNDIRTQVLQAKRKYNGNVPIEIKEQLYNSLPSEKLPNVIYKNTGDLAFEDISDQWGLSNPSFSNGAATADFDNDGDLELVVNNMDDEAFFYKNVTVENGLGNYLKVDAKSNNGSPFAKVYLKYNGKQQMVESKNVRGYLSSMSSTAHFGLGDIQTIDTVRVEWPSGNVDEQYNVTVNSSITISEKNAGDGQSNHTADASGFFREVEASELNLEYAHEENDFDDFEIESLLPYKQSTLGPFISSGDINGDGLADLYVGGAMNQSGALYMQRADQKFQRIPTPAISADARHEDMESVFFDVDNDGDNDLFIVSGGYEFIDQADEYQDRLYINDGTGRFNKSIDPTLLSKKFSGKTVAIVDYNKDGLKDVVVGNRVVPGNYPKSPTSILYRNTGQSFEDVTNEVIPDLASFGMVNKIISTDFDQDGFEDLIVVGEWTHIGLFKNENGRFKDVAKSNDLNLARGWWYTVSETDANKDGLPDYVIGNIGLNSKYKASFESPLKIFAEDFDQNGTWDIVLSGKYNNEYVPFRGRQCSSEQMPFISEKFPTYDLFAKASLVDVYGDKLNSAVQKEVTEFGSILLLNKGNATFEKMALPRAAQIAPILSCEPMDVNKDGYEDLVLAGNIYNTEVETPRLDAGTGMVLISDGKGHYVSRNTSESKLYVPGNIKSMQKIQVGEDVHLLFGINNDSLKVIRVNR